MLIVLLLAGCVIAVGIGLSWMSRQAPDIGLVDGKLRVCPDTPNCVCSELPATDSQHAIAAIPVNGMDSDVAWHMFRQVVEQQGGRINQQGAHYLHATFTTRLFRYIDDVEARLDADVGLIHVRSASRVGHSDMGANRARIEAIRQQFEHRNHSIQPDSS